MSTWRPSETIARQTIEAFLESRAPQYPRYDVAEDGDDHLAIDLRVANALAQQLMCEVIRLQKTANAISGEWISALMQLTASYVVNADPVSTQSIVRMFELYVERAQAVRLSTIREG